MADEGRIIEFYGTECPHCHEMEPLIERLERETPVKITRLEVWHNEENRHLMQHHAAPILRACGGVLGVPAFYNERTRKALCGEQAYEDLRAWALEEPDRKLAVG